MQAACLVDVTRCTGCRSCQVACKQANRLAAERAKFFAAPGGYQNPRRYTPRTFTYLRYYELDDAQGQPVWLFVKHQCLHCEHMYCAYVCGPQVFSRTPSGVVTYRPEYCIGCAACVDSCPFAVPTIDYWDLTSPRVSKCGFCLDRQEAAIDAAEVDGQPLSGAALQRHRASFTMPACAKTCPTGALQFGDRDELLAEADRRIAAAPGKYVDHVYGRTEAGGTRWLYLSPVPFERLGFPTTFQSPQTFQKPAGVGASSRRYRALSSLGKSLAALAAGLCWFFQRRDEISRRLE